MRAFIELRVNAKYAKLLFSDDEGEVLSSGLARKVVLDCADSRYARLAHVQAECEKTFGEPFFFGWITSYKYTAKEIADAKLFHLWPTKMFEPAGEECGTVYLDKNVCGKCGTGAVQSGPLRLKRIPFSKSVILARSIADEWLIRADLVKALARAHVTGLTAQPIQAAITAKNGASEFTSSWMQLRDGPALVDLHGDTSFGNSPIDLDKKGEHRCLPHLLGLNVLSPVTVAADSWDGTDIVFSSAMVGRRGGLLRQRRLILVSPRFANALRKFGGTGYRLDVAYLK